MNRLVKLNRMEKEARAYLVSSGFRKYLTCQGLEKLAQNPRVITQILLSIQNLAKQELNKTAEDLSPWQHLKNLASEGLSSTGIPELWKGLNRPAKYAIGAGIPAFALGAGWEGLRPREEWDAPANLQSMLFSGLKTGLPAALGGGLYGTLTDESQKAPSPHHKDIEEQQRRKRLAFVRARQAKNLEQAQEEQDREDLLAEMERKYSGNIVEGPGGLRSAKSYKRLTPDLASYLLASNLHRIGKGLWSAGKSLFK